MDDIQQNRPIYDSFLCVGHKNHRWSVRQKKNTRVDAYLGLAVMNDLTFLAYASQ